MVMLGCDFDRDPQIPWAGRDIDHPSIPSIAKRIAHVSEAALRFLGETAGQNNSHLVRAMLRIKRNDTSALDGLQEDDLPEGVLAFLTALYPEKGRLAGDECMETLTENRHRIRARTSAVAPRAVGIHAFYMFMLGVGYDRDPLYNWLGDRLDDAIPPVEWNARFGRMMEGVDRIYRRRTARKQKPGIMQRERIERHSKNSGSGAQDDFAQDPAPGNSDKPACEEALDWRAGS